MIVNGRVGVDPLIRLAQIFFCQSILTGFVVRPTERIQKRAILRIEIDSFADQCERFGKTNTTIGEHIAEIVQDRRILRIDDKRFTKLSLGKIVLFLPVVERSSQERDVKLLIRLCSQRLGAAQLRSRLRPALQPGINLRQSKM